MEWGDKVVELKERADILLAENAVMVEQHNVVRQQALERRSAAIGQTLAASTFFSVLLRGGQGGDVYWKC